MASQHARCRPGCEECNEHEQQKLTVSQSPTTCSPIEATMSYMLRQGNHYHKIKPVDAKLVHDLDVKYVQTAETEMVDGDTLIIINVPEGRQASNHTCNGGTFPLAWRLRMDSRDLRYSGFMLFPRLLDDAKYQARQVSRLKAKGAMPNGVDYVLDLGPSSNEEVQAAQLQHLSLSKGIMRWYKTQFSQPLIVRELVAGHDECCECWGKEMEGKGEDVLGSVKWASRCIWDNNIEPYFRDIPDYCEFRHATNVVRLLRKIAGMPGGTLLLDSAPRAFTIAGIVKMFEVAYCDSTIWLRDAALEWVNADRNCDFVDILTEDAIIMAYNMQVPEIAKVAFGLLANESALQMESGLQPPRGGYRYSVFGRRLRDINDDEIQTAVEHAGRAFAERILGILARLKSDDVLEWLQLREWQKVREIIEGLADKPGIDVENLREALEKVRTSLVEYIRYQIKKAMSAYHVITTDAYDKALRLYLPQSRHTPFKGIWCGLNENQKALTSVFWRNLGKEWAEKALFFTSDYRLAMGVTLQEVVAPLNCLLEENGHSQFVVAEISWQLKRSIDQIICKPLYNSEYARSPFSTETTAFRFLSPNLISLNEDELRFLPLWAGGLNDGSGGVYESDAPPSDMGPSGPGPSYHTGYTVATETAPSDAFSSLGGDDNDNEVRTDYTSSTVGDVNRDMADLDIQSLASSSSVSGLGLGVLDIQSQKTTASHPSTNAASMGDTSSSAPPASSLAADDDFADARFAVPAPHQAVGQAIEHLVVDLHEGGDAHADHHAQASAAAEVSTSASVASEYDFDIAQYSDDDDNYDNDNGEDFDDGMSDRSVTPTPSVVGAAAGSSSGGGGSEDREMSDALAATSSTGSGRIDQGNHP